MSGRSDSTSLPHFEFFVILDSEEDPDMQVVCKIQQNYPEFPLHVQVLQERHTTYSLKCDCLRQGIHSLDPSFEIITFIDGDVIPHTHWIEEQVAPFHDEKIEFTTGYRRLFSVRFSMGSWVRYIWNLASYVHVYLSGIIWGGSCVVRQTTLETPSDGNLDALH